MLAPAVPDAPPLTPISVVVGIDTDTLGEGVLDSVDFVGSAVSDAPLLILISVVVVGIDADTIDVGVLDSVESVGVDPVVSDLLGLVVLDAPSLMLVSVVLVGIGTGTIGLGVLDSTVDSVSVGSVWLDFVALACVVSESTGTGVCLVVPLVSTVSDIPVVDSGDSETLAEVTCEDSTTGTNGLLLLEALAVVLGPETPSVLDWTGSIVVGLVAVLEGMGTGTIGFGVLDSTGSEATDPEDATDSEATDSEDVLDAVNEVDSSGETGSGVSVGAESTGSLEAKSVRLRLAVALAVELGFPSVDVRREVVIFESCGMGTTGGITNELEAIADDSSLLG